MRRAFAPSLLPSLPLLYAVAGCTSLIGDFDWVPPPVDAAARDSAVETDGTELDVPVATVVAAVVTPPPVYVGQSVTLDASSSTTTQGSLAFSWELDTVPDGSLLTTASLSSISSATSTMVPDVPGSYSLTVTVSAGGATASQQVVVVAVAPQVMFARGAVGDGGLEAGASLEYWLANAGPDSGTIQPLICSDAYLPASSAPLGAYASRGFDFWEAAAGLPSRFAAFTMEATADGGYIGHLWAGTSEANCPPPFDVGTYSFGPNAPFGSQPRFSPDGSRFAVFDSSWNIVTYPFDGNGETNVVAAYGLSYADAGAALDAVDELADSGYVLEPPRVAWTAAGTLAWARPLAADQWEVVSAPDVANAPLTTYMVCPGTMPREIAMLSDGTVMASYRDPSGSYGPGENILRLRPDVLHQCGHEEYAGGSEATSVATDFAVSPDETQLAFLWRDPAIMDGAAWPGGFPGGYVFVMPLSNPGAAVQVSDDPALYGPRWIAAGAALEFTRFDGVAPSTGGLQTSVVVVSPDGGAEQVLAQGDGVATFVSTSGNAACDAAPGTGGRLPWTLSVALVALARRARRPRRSFIRSPGNRPADSYS